MLVYDQYDIVRKSLDFIVRSADQLDVVVIENISRNTPKIQKYVHKLAEQGKIKRYYLFEENIANNAYSVVLKNERDILRKSKYVILTDGDVASNSDEWLNEELSILRNHSVFACGAMLSLHNLPLNTFPDAIHWIPQPTSRLGEYDLGPTGVHLLMVRSYCLLLFLKWMHLTKSSFIDDRLYYFCTNILHMKWARTRREHVTHLTWDLYSDAKNTYTKMKTETPFDQIWRSRKSSNYTIERF